MVQPSMGIVPDKVMVFVDASNLYFAIRDGLGEKGKYVDLEKLSRKLVGPRQLIRINLYSTHSPRPDSPGGKAHEGFLHKMGWLDFVNVRFGRIVRRNGKLSCAKCGNEWWNKTYTQKGVDTRIAVDLVTLAVRGTYDTAILICGDSDLTEAVKFVNETTNKRVDNAFIPWKGWATDLREASTTKIQLTKEYLADCWTQSPFEDSETPS